MRKTERAEFKDEFAKVVDETLEEFFNNMESKVNDIKR